MSEMIDRVARALYERDHASENWDASYAEYFRWDGPNFKGQDYFRGIARAAIEAMREPTFKMIDAAVGYDSYSEMYQAMIDAALPHGDS